MARTIQISAHLSAPTRELLERYTRATGVKKQHLIEQALLHHLRALQELPADVIVPARMVVSAERGERLLGDLATKRKPNKALRDLMRRAR